MNITTVHIYSFSTRDALLTIEFWMRNFVYCVLEGNRRAEDFAEESASCKVKETCGVYFMRMMALSSRDRKLRFTVFMVWVATASAQYSVDCPLGWHTFQSQCYRFVFFPELTYKMADMACQLDGAYLLSVNSNAEHEFVSLWLTDHDKDRTRRWWTSGMGQGQQLHWQGDGTVSALDDSTKWEGEQVRQQASLHVVYKFTTLTNSYLWSRQKDEAYSPYICEISHQQAFRITQARRDHTFGTPLTDPMVADRGPRFTTLPQSLVVVGRMETAFLECDVDSQPLSAYTWYKKTEDGKLVTISTAMSDRYSLTNGRFAFQNPDPKMDAGDYHCIAENKFGSIRSHSVSVSFGYLMEFSNDPPGAVRANQYQGTYMACNAPDYNPDISYQWYKGPGANFLRTDLNQYLFISHNGRLYMSETQLGDAGMYHCVVTLVAPVGQVVDTVQPPSAASLGIELILRGDTATEFGPLIHDDFPAYFPSPVLRGVDLRIECFAYGRLPLYYTWRRDNGPIPKKARYSDLDRVLVLPNIQLEDSGNYTCRVERGTRASHEKTLTISVEAVPFFVFPLRDQHVDIHSTFSLRCEAMAVPLPSYSWFKDGQPLTSVEGQIEVKGNVVTFTRADPKRHNGMYQCAASNVYGTRLSSAEVRVLEFKPSFTKRPLVSSQQATMGGNTTLLCQPEAAPTPAYSWARNGRDLGLTAGVQGHVTLLSNGNLFITGVQASDQGEYTCTATNSGGSASSSGLLTVVSQTTITIPPSNTQVKVNESAFLTCEASADRRHQDLTYVWAFNGHQLDVDHLPEYRGKTRINGLHGLHVIDAQFRHEGWYECTAVTVGDRASAAAYLTVRGPPSEPAGLKAEDDVSNATHVILDWIDGTDRGSTITFYVIEFKSNFFPVWRVKEEKVATADTFDPEDNTHRKFKVTDLSPGSSYSFRVKAVNEFGPGDACLPSAFVKILDAPPKKAPQNIANGHSSVGTLAFTWKQLNPEDLTGQDRGYRLYWRSKTDTIHDHRQWETDTVTDDKNSFVAFIGGDNYYLPYEVKVAAFNSLGDGPNTSVVEIMSQEGMPVEAPTNVAGEDFNSTAFYVTWNAPVNTRKTMRGKLLGFQVDYWLETDTSHINVFLVHCTSCTQGLIIGLNPNDDYWVQVHVFNSAGIGPKGEQYRISTTLNAPFLYPEYVSVSSMDGPRVYVTWRGVPIGLEEEALSGYKVLWWPMTENIRTANEVKVEERLQTWAVIEGVREGIVYALRVQGYNNGGDGKKSPTTYFTLEGLVPIVPETTEILATGSYVRASLWLLMVSYLGQTILFS